MPVVLIFENFFIVNLNNLLNNKKFLLNNIL